MNSSSRVNPRNFRRRNRDSRRRVFLKFLCRVKELVNSDCRFGFLVKSCIYSQLDTSRIQKFDPKIRNFQTLGPKNSISYRMSPPYASPMLHPAMSGRGKFFRGRILGGFAGMWKVFLKFDPCKHRRKNVKHNEKLI